MENKQYIDDQVEKRVKEQIDLFTKQIDEKIGNAIDKRFRELIRFLPTQLSGGATVDIQSRAALTQLYSALHNIKIIG